jgi:hypothetical protein
MIGRARAWLKMAWGVAFPWRPPLWYLRPCPQCGHILDVRAAPRFPGPPGHVLLLCGCGAWLPWPSVVGAGGGMGPALPWEEREFKGRESR